ncbi:Helix-destabilizing protein [Stenotrophomonas sp. RIT309]|uniref:single-stranded DNA-binding protein n=1 Tax=Stenotrophomonas sp. RIT309 TaxID=1470590 RepID=UPI000449BE67|nr:single-stranded DNA-binding protein [Stenotrophomonas sp. RIT309]EZP47888.1 Helix-destabilizing protein [Stenotrophomonas sp. RIT309]
MSIKVTVLKSEIDERGGSFKNDKGEDVAYSTRKQKGKLETDGFAYPFDVRLQDGQPGYPQGEYELDVESMLQVNKGVATLSKYTVLRQLPKAAPRAAAQA